MCKSANLSCKIALQNAGCVFLFFVADIKIVCGYDFGAPLISLHALFYKQRFNSGSMLLNFFMNRAPNVA